ncbi:MAG: hypothetical protein ACT4NL_00185, partial [Pseudomarimonas sp.]
MNPSTASNQEVAAEPAVAIDRAQWLRAILTAPVYDVARRTPLEAAPRISNRIGNQVLLKREDLQPVF